MSLKNEAKVKKNEDKEKSAFDTSMVWISFLHRWKAERSESSKIYTLMRKFCFLLAILGEVLERLTLFYYNKFIAIEKFLEKL